VGASMPRAVGRVQRWEHVRMVCGWLHAVLFMKGDA
jgi:hypothetical protein